MSKSAISVEIEGARVAKNVPVVSCVCGRGRWDVSSSARVSGSGSLSLAVIGKYTWWHRVKSTETKQNGELLKGKVAEP